MGNFEPSMLKQITDTILCDVEDFSVEFFQEESRNYLGGSVIGEKCARKLWYDFRHCKDNKIKPSSQKSPGQLYRLFNRGHREETFFKQMLSGAGCIFLQHPDGPDKQFKVTDCNGHFGSSVDAIGYLPKKFGIQHKVGFEFKTANMSEFNRVKKDGVKIYQPKHHSQMSVLGYKFELPLFLYCVVDKNSDEYYLELIETDAELGREMIEKADIVIKSQIPLPRISMQVTNWACKACSFQGLCFNKEKANINCRTCVYSQPTDNGEWLCNIAKAVPPADIQKTGCQAYQPIDVNS